MTGSANTGFTSSTIGAAATSRRCGGCLADATNTGFAPVTTVIGTTVAWGCLARAAHTALPAGAGGTFVCATVAVVVDAVAYFLFLGTRLGGSFGYTLTPCTHLVPTTVLVGSTATLGRELVAFAVFAGMSLSTVGSCPTFSVRFS